MNYIVEYEEARDFMHLINDNIQKLFALCRKYKVSKLYAFGSILTPRFNDQSDVDILVDFNSEIDHNNYADNFFDLYHALKDLFGRDVDLVDETSVKKSLFQRRIRGNKTSDLWIENCGNICQTFFRLLPSQFSSNTPPVLNKINTILFNTMI